MSGRTLLGSALVGSIVALVVSAVARRLGPRIGAMDRPGELKPHEAPVPYLGGFAVAFGLACGLAIHGWNLTWGGSVAIGGALLLGTADDALGLSPAARLPAMFALGLALPAPGVTLSALPGGRFVAWVLPIVVYVVSLNAVNMVDGIDGLAGSAAAISALGLAAIARNASAPGPELIAIVVAAACFGFVLHNLPPARLFLGDGGAYLLGGALALVIVSSTASGATFLGGVTCMGIFLMDLGLAVLRRLLGRASLTAGDRGHLYDQFRSRGLSGRQTLGVSLVIHLAIVGAGVRTAELPLGQTAIILGGLWALVVAWLIWSGFVTMSP